jgi:hypothetical protein
MGTDALIAAFRRLQSNDERQEALETLLQELTPYEWRTLHKNTSARSFQFDIIGRLPIELVAQVFAYMDTSAPYRLQRVNILPAADVTTGILTS